MATRPRPSARTHDPAGSPPSRADRGCARVGEKRALSCDSKRRSKVGETERVVLCHLPDGTAIVGRGYNRVLAREWWELRYKRDERFGSAQYQTRDAADAARDHWRGITLSIVHVRRYRIVRST